MFKQKYYPWDMYIFIFRAWLFNSSYRSDIWFLMQDVSGSLDFCKVCHLIFYYTLWWAGLLVILIFFMSWYYLGSTNLSPITIVHVFKENQKKSRKLSDSTVCHFLPNHYVCLKYRNYTNEKKKHYILMHPKTALWCRSPETLTTK